MIGILVLTPDDWRLWRGLRRAALAEAPGAFGSTLSEWSGAGDTEQRWRARLENVAFNIVLTWNDEPAGMVSATTPGDDGATELISMWVAPSARGHGLGDAAVRQVMAWAQTIQGGSRLVLSVKRHNDWAIRLYQRHGFTDARPSADDPDERLMSIDLRASP